MALLDYLPTTQTQQGGGQASSPEAVKQLREYAKALMVQKQKPTQLGFYSPWQGASDAAGDMLAAYQMRQANENEDRSIGVRGTERENFIKQGAGYGSDATGAGGPGSVSRPPQGEGEDGQPPSSQTQYRFPQKTSQGEGQPTRLASLGTTPDISEAAMRLSSRGETGKDPGMAALFNISPDTKNSKSYGPLGLNSRSDSAAQFAKENPKLGLTAKPGTPEFDAQWRRASAVMPDEMESAHRDYHQKHIMAGLTEDMTSRGVDPRIANDPKVQTYMADRKLQMNKVGLDRAMLYARTSNSPEEFIHKLSDADRQNIPYNFPSYLEDHPNNARGLSNRIDLRHNTALGLDNLDQMVDYHRNGGQAPQGGPPGTQVAQNNNQLPVGALQGQIGRFVGEMARRGKVEIGADDPAIALRMGTMPQYGPANEFGQGSITEPGRPPQPYMVPGYAGKIGTFGKSGIPTQQYLVPGAPGQPPQLKTIISPPTVNRNQSSASPPGGTTPPANAPASAVVQNPTAPQPTSQTPPATTATPPAGAQGGPLTTAPPQGKPQGQPAQPVPSGGALASNPPNQAEEFPYQLASNALMGPPRPVTQQQLALAETAAVKAPAANGKTGEDWQQFVAEGLSMPRIPSAYEAPDVMGKMEQLSSDDPASSRKAMNDLMGLDKIEDSELNNAKTKDEKTAAENAELSKSIMEGGAQAIKLQQGLKMGIQTLDNKAYESGPLAGTITLMRGFADEAKRWLGKQKNPDGSPAYPGAEKILKDMNWESPAANQVFAKVIASSVLQSLRQMLGPNAGQFRVQELKLLEQSYGNENLSLAGNKMVMNMIDRLNDRAIVTNRMANEYRKARGGTLDANFNTVLDKYAEAHPAFTPDEIIALGNIEKTGDPSGKPPAAPAPAAPAAPYKLRPGFRLE